MQKISDFLKDLNSHSIYAEPTLSADFERTFGKKAPWPTHSIGRTSTSTGQFKGVEGELRGKDSDRCSYGYEIAAACEQEFAKTSEFGNYHGRGSAFRASIAALEKAGL